MLDFQQKRKFKAILYHRITLVVLAVLVLLVLHSTWVVYKKERESQDMKNVSLQHVEDLRQRNDDLNSKIDKLATVSGVEEEIRVKFSVAKDNETMVVIVPSQEALATTTKVDVGFWEKLKNMFLGK